MEFSPIKIDDLVLVGGWATPLKNMKVSWDDYKPNINGTIKNGNQTTNHGQSYPHFRKVSISPHHHLSRPTWGPRTSPPRIKACAFTAAEDMCRTRLPRAWTNAGKMRSYGIFMGCSCDFNGILMGINRIFMGFQWDFTGFLWDSHGI